VSDRHFWQLYAISGAAVLWLYVLAVTAAFPAWRARRRRRNRIVLPAPWDGAIVRNWREPYR
jgi:hypothetical protein